LNISPDRYRSEGVRLLRTSDVGGDGSLDEAGGVFLDPADVPPEMRLRDGDLLFSRSGTIGRGFLFDAGRQGPATFAGFLVRFRVKPEIDSRAIRYWSESTPFIGAVESGSIQSTIANFNAEKYASLLLPAPVVEHSRAIADYLDAETARIDAVVERRRAQLTAFRDRLFSEVERRVLGVLGVVTSGHASQRLPFFLSRPIDWNETTLRHLGVEVQTGPFGSQLHADEYVEGGTPVINPMHLVDGMIVPSDNMTVADRKKRDLSRHLLVEGDIVVARRGELGRVAVVDQVSAGNLCGTGCLRLRPTRSLVRTGYLSMLLSSAPLRGYFDTASVGSTMDNLSAETLLAAPVLVPPLDEQADIESAVETARRRAESVIGLMSRQIELLLERRQALITAAVTGQLEIPGVAA
jgi:type I restriction enzyme S subunit